MESFFVWNIQPEVFSFSPIPRWYSLLFAGGLWGGYSIIEYFWKRAKDSRRTVESLQTLFIYFVVGMFIGMRLGHCFFYEPAYYLENPLEIFMIWKGGYASHGGFAGIILAIYLFARRYPGTSFMEIADNASVGPVFTAAMIRIGNFFNSEMIGHPTQEPWAVIFAQVDSVPRHPAQLYEAIGYLVICAITSFLTLKTNITSIRGRMFGLILTSTFSWRFICEFFKEDQSAFEQGMTFNMGQLLSVPFIFVGLALLIWGFKNKNAERSHDHT